jgi:membrane protein DedA with SNARE-associated domain
MIEKLTTRISKGGQLSIYIFRLTPFTRGYTSVITGLLQVKPKIFLPLALISGITWATIYVVIGHFIGPSWHLFTKNIDSLKYIMFGILVVVLCVFLVVYLNRKRGKSKENAGVNNSLTI